MPRRGGSAASVRMLVRRMEPYSAVLWRIPYALNEDFDLMLTPWGARALDALHEDWGRSPNEAWRFLGVWNVGKVLLRKDGTIDDSVCETTEATMSLYEDADGTARDFVLCVGPV